MNTELDLIYLIYGSAFLAMGVAVLVRQTPIRHQEISQSFRWLGLFGVLHGLTEWSYLPAVRDLVFMGSPYPAAFLAGVSYCALIKFAFKLHQRTASNHFLNQLALPLIVGLLIILLIFLNEQPQRDFAIRYVIGIPGSFGAALVLYQNRNRLASDRLNTIWPKLAATGFLSYCLLTSITSTAVGLPSFVFDQSDFAAAFGFPVQIARTTSAIFITATIYKTLAIFDVLEKETLSEAVQEATSSLNRSEQSYRSLFENAGVGMAMVSSQGKYLRVNKAFTEFIGYPEKTLLEMGPCDVTHPDDLEKVSNALSQWSSLQRTFIQHEKRYLTRTGAISWAQVTVSVGTTDEDGNPVAVAQIEDINDRKRAEEALRESEEQNREILDKSPIGIAVVDHFPEASGNRTKRLFANNALARMFGYSTLDALYEMDIHKSWVDPRKLEEARAIIGSGRDLIDFEGVRYRSDGSEWWVSINSRPVRFNGQTCTMLWHFDVTERRNAEEELRKSQDLLLEAQRMAKLGSWELNHVTGMLTWSDEIYRMFAIDPEQFGASYEAFLNAIHPEDKEAVNKAYSDSLTHRSPYNIDHRLLMPDGRIKWVQERCRTVFGKDGSPLLSFGTVQDVTGRHEAERKIEQLNESLERRVEERTKALEEAQAELVRNERLATLGKLSATVSHELRNPLGTISASVFSLAKKVRDRGIDIERPLGRIERNIERCSLIIDEMLDYARSRPPELALVKVDDWLKSVLSEYEVPAGINLSTDLNAPNQVLALDAERMRRAITNLIDNARHAVLEVDTSSNRDKSIILASRLTHTDLEITISDTGPGMSSDILDHIFEPLYSTKSFGVGLGLSIVKQIVEAHAGTLKIKSDPDLGTEAVLCLPLQYPSNSRSAAE